MIATQFVKFNHNKELPKNIQGKYYLYYSFGLNVKGDGIPAIYIKLDSIDKLTNFVKEISKNSTILLKGIDDFIINDDYYINKSVYSWLYGMSNDNGSSDGSSDTGSDDIIQYFSDIVDVFENDIVVLPNYINKSSLNINTDYFDIINSTENLLDHYIKQNKFSNFTFTETELNNFSATFCNVILSMSSMIDNSTTNNVIYKKVLEYFANSCTDSVLLTMQIMLNNNIQNTNTQNVSPCNCNSITSSDTICISSCSDYYINAMNEYLKFMLGNIEFYKDWFYTNIDDVEFINTDLISQLKILLNELLESGISLDTTEKQKIGLGCPSLSATSDDCNRSIIKNYIKILDYIEDDDIDSNINKIKVYGSAFAELLTKL